MLTAHEVRKVAVLSETDPRTVRRVLAGRAVRPLSRARIERALVECARPGAPLREEEQRHVIG